MRARLVLPILVASSLACGKSSPTEVRVQKVEASDDAGAAKPARQPDTVVPLPVVYLGDELALRLPASGDAIAAAEDGFELVEAGAEPRTQLRFSPQVGHGFGFEVTVQLKMSVDGEATPGTAQLMPRIHRFGRAQITKAGPRIEQALTLERFEVEAVRESDPVADLMRRSTGEIASFTQTLVHDPRGALVEGEPSLPPDVSKALRRTLEELDRGFVQLLIPLPEEPVGLGARWRETSEHQSGGIDLVQNAEFELVAANVPAPEGPGTVTATIALTQRPKTTTFRPPERPEVEVEIVEFDARGAGTVVYDLGEMLPRHGEIRVDTAFTFEASAGESKQRMRTEVSVAVVLDRVTE